MLHLQCVDFQYLVNFQLICLPRFWAVINTYLYIMIIFFCIYLKMKISVEQTVPLLQYYVMNSEQLILQFAIFSIFYFTILLQQFLIITGKYWIQRR